MNTHIRKRRCTGCKGCFAEFALDNGLTKFCTKDCAIDYAISNKKELVKKGKERKQKLFDAETKERKRKSRDSDKRYWTKKAQDAFNAYIRERDKEQPCISCQRHHQGQYHAGHYRTTKAAPQLRFDESNVQKQCMPCNSHLSGNIGEYRINLVKKIGIEAVEALECNQEIKRYSVDELKQIEKKYKEKIKKALQSN